MAVGCTILMTQPWSQVRHEEGGGEGGGGRRREYEGHTRRREKEGRRCERKGLGTPSVKSLLQSRRPLHYICYPVAQLPYSLTALDVSPIPPLVSTPCARPNPFHPVTCVIPAP